MGSVIGSAHIQYLSCHTLKLNVLHCSIFLPRPLGRGKWSTDVFPPPQICPLIPKQLLEFSKLKNQTKKLPLKIKKPKISLKSQNVKKQTPSKYAHRFQNNFRNFQNSKNQTKK